MSVTNATGKRIDLPLRPDLVAVIGNGATIVIAGDDRWVDYDVANDTLGIDSEIVREASERLAIRFSKS